MLCVQRRVPSSSFPHHGWEIIHQRKKANFQMSIVNCKTICQRSQLILSAILKLSDRLTSQTMKMQLIIWRVTHWCNKDGLLGGAGEECLWKKKNKRLQIDFLKTNRKGTKPKKNSWKHWTDLDRGEQQRGGQHSAGIGQIAAPRPPPAEDLGYQHLRTPCTFLSKLVDGSFFFHAALCLWQRPVANPLLKE